LSGAISAREVTYGVQSCVNLSVAFSGECCLL